jgi:hypothetical protein
VYYNRTGSSDPLPSYLTQRGGIIINISFSENKTKQLLNDTSLYIANQLKYFLEKNKNTTRYFYVNLTHKTEEYLNYYTSIPTGNYDLFVNNYNLQEISIGSYINLIPIYLDEDQDGWDMDQVGGSDCNDSNPSINQNASETCNNIDDNCNAQTDEIFSDKGTTCSIGIGECKSEGFKICSLDGLGTTCNAVAKNPSQEICNDEKDNDCDGLTDINDLLDCRNDCFIYDDFSSGNLNASKWFEYTGFKVNSFTDEHFVNTEGYHVKQNVGGDRETNLMPKREFIANELFYYEITYKGGSGNHFSQPLINGNYPPSQLETCSASGGCGPIGYWNGIPDLGMQNGTYKIKYEFSSHEVKMTALRPDNVVIVNTFTGNPAPYNLTVNTHTGNNGLMHVDYDNFIICPVKEKPAEPEEPLILVLNSPSKDIFNTKKIPVNITMTEQVDKITYIDNTDSKPREKTLCKKNCNGYGNDKSKTVSFKEGYHTVIFKAIKNNTLIDEASAYFLIDDTNPKITKTEPRRGETNGSFTIEFVEENAAELAFFFENNKQTYSSEINYSCSLANNRYKCQIIADLSAFKNQEIKYWFELTDIAGNKDDSSKRKVMVIELS